MSAAPIERDLIAIVGIDGAGKTTVIDQLRALPAYRTVEFIHKVNRDNTRRLERMFPGEAERPGAYWKGNFAKAWRWAHALDFLRFYEEEFLPRIAAGKRVIADRWIECVSAFADAGTGIRGQIEESILKGCRRAGLVIMIDVDPAVARARIEARGDAKPDEELGLLHAYRDAYFRVLADCPSPVVVVPGTTRRETLSTVDRAIKSHWT